MKFSLRQMIIGFGLLVLVFLGMLFWPFVFSSILQPIALVLWLFLRLFVLSIDQAYIWGVLVIGAIFFLFRLLPKHTETNQMEENMPVNETLNSINIWSHLVNPGENLDNDRQVLRREFGRILTRYYANSLHRQPDFQLYDALHRGEIPLPTGIYALVFEEENRRNRNGLRGMITSVINTPRRWVRRWKGQDRADHYRMIDEMLSFMESSLEMKKDDKTSTFNSH